MQTTPAYTKIPFMKGQISPIWLGLGSVPVNVMITSLRKRFHFLDGKAGGEAEATS